MIPAVLTHCAGIDIGKRNLAVCLMVGPAESEPRVEVREFSTFNADLEAMKRWLVQAGCTHVVMESTGPRGTPEKRPMRDTSKPANGREAGQELLYPTGGGVGNSFFAILIETAYTVSTWAEDTAPQGCDRSAVPGPEWRGRRGRPAPLPFWRECVKSREREGSALASERSLLPYCVHSVGRGGLGAPALGAAFQHMAMV